MAFRKVNENTLIRFNSKNSSDLLDRYEEYVKQCIQLDNSSKHNKTFAPSQFACDRLSWFRLRGVLPDVSNNIDLQLDYSAKIGTACHEMLQSRLSSMLGDCWIPVSEYLANYPITHPYSLEDSDNGLEILVTITEPPVRFACDGVVLLNGKYYILEIKTSDYNSWANLEGPKSRHIDQVKCYSSLLNIQDVMFIYQDRTYGQLKMYEVHFTTSDTIEVIDKMKRILQAVDDGIAPDGLHNDSFWCNSNVCPYYKKCKEYGNY